MSQTAATNPFVGTWKLVSWRTARTDGTVFPGPMAERPRGIIMYDPKGNWLCYIEAADRKPFTANDRLRGTPEEIKAAFESVIAYGSTYQVDLANKVLLLNVEGSLFPNWSGTAQRWFYEFSGNTYMLKTPPIKAGGEEVVVTLTWERIY